MFRFCDRNHLLLLVGLLLALVALERGANSALVAHFQNQPVPAPLRATFTAAPGLTGRAQLTRRGAGTVVAWDAAQRRGVIAVGDTQTEIQLTGAPPAQTPAPGCQVAASGWAAAPSSRPTVVADHLAITACPSARAGGATLHP